jgi:hypothetical protein
MNTGEAVEVCDHFTFVDVEHDKLVRVHMRKVEPAMGLVETLIIEAHRWAGHGDVGNHLEGPGFLFFRDRARDGGNNQANSQRDQTRC